MIFRWIAIASLSLLLWNLRQPSTAQSVGDRIGDVCRVIAIDDTIENTTELALYARPIVTTAQTTETDYRSAQQARPADPNRITLLFDQEQIALLNANQTGVDGDRHLWHEIEDSIGNRGYMLAIDPATQQSTLRNCF
jgi:hypothetical protein